MMQKRNTINQIFFFAIVFLVCNCNIANAQFDGHFSLHHLTKTFYNPAAIGTEDYMKVHAAQRIQTVEIKNSPLTTFFTVNSPFNIKKTSHAAGIEFVNDMFGVFANQQINLQYAYKFKLKKFTISIGANLGVMNIICYGDSIKMVESEYHSENDPAIPLGTQSGVGFDMGLGVYLYGQNWNTGIAVKHLPGTNVRLGERYGFKTTQLLSFMGGYSFAIPNNKKYRIEPSAIVYTDLRSFQFNIQALLRYNEKFWGGIGYSLQNAVSIMLGAEIFNGLNLAYCYDLPASEFIQVTHGSHEISLMYHFNLKRNKSIKKHKSIRIL